MAMYSAVQGPMPEMAVRRALLHEGKQYVVVPIGGREVPGQWIALSLP